MVIFTVKCLAEILFLGGFAYPTGLLISWSLSENARQMAKLFDWKGSVLCNLQHCWLSELQAGIKTDGRNISNLRYANDATLKAESGEELKSLLMKVREESHHSNTEFLERKKQTKFCISALITVMLYIQCFRFTTLFQNQNLCSCFSKIAINCLFHFFSKWVKYICTCL